MHLENTCAPVQIYSTVPRYVTFILLLSLLIPLSISLFANITAGDIHDALTLLDISLLGNIN